ncbi:MAG: hypothetical protein JNK57_20945 [Planctomycetaceae bacterium]|nr:hypothetical protein [Planctomycetaceae bacterium]
MAIQVTCGSCFTRFSVSDKFAGQKGPCPKCKTVITIPTAAEQVVIHERESGPKDTAGRPVLRPIFRQETPITAIHWTIAACTAVVMLVVAIVGRSLYTPETFPWFGMLFGTIVCSFPVALVGYIVLRNPEAPGFGGQELWLRIAIVALGFAILWSLSPIAAFAFADPIEKPSFLSQSVAMVAMVLAGAGISLLALELDYLLGLVHATAYATICIVMRMLAGLPAIPGLDVSVRAAPEAPVEFGWIGPETAIPMLTDWALTSSTVISSFSLLGL